MTSATHAAPDPVGERAGSSLDREFSRALLESMSDGVVACDADGVLTLFNRAAREWHGTDPVRLSPEEWPSHYDLYREDGVTPLPPAEVPLARAFRGEAVVDAAMAIAVEGRPIRYVLANGGLIIDEAGRKLGAVVVMRDITELRRVTAELRRANEALEARVAERTAQLAQSEERYRSIFDNVLDGLYLLEVLGDGRFRTLEVNPALEAATGVPRRLSLGRTQEETVDPETARAVNAKYQRCVEAGHPIEEELALQLPAGRRFFHSTLIPIRDRDGRVCRILGISRDVTDRKRAEEALHRLNRQLRAISECNQLLMRAADEPTLLEKVCRIICERAGYRTAWVGICEQDEERSIRPVAFAGVDEGYVERARLSWGDGPRGRGPAGMAVRSGTTVTAQDLSRCPEFAPWLDEASKRGFRSAIWLPLRDGSGSVFGLLLIYSAEVDAFSRDEIAVLEELAGDLALGVSVLRDRERRKEAEHRIALLSFALNNVRDSAFLIDAQARFRYVNDEACRLLGWDREDLLKRSVADVDPDFPPERWPAHWKELQEKRSLHFEGRHRTRDGRVFPVEISASYFEYEGQGYNLALAHDITARQAAEAALRTADKRYRRAQEIGHVGNWEYDVRTTEFWGSDEAKRIYGFDPAQGTFSTEEVEGCIPERERVHQALVDLLERGTPYDLVFEIHPRGSTESRIIASTADVRRDEDGRPLLVTGVIHDITQRARAEAALRASEQSLALHILQTPLGVIEWDLGFRVTQWNPAAERIFGYLREEAIGAHASFIVPASARAHVDEVWGALVAQRGGLRSTNENVTRDGRTIYCEWYNTPLVDRHGKVVAVASLVQDVTDRRRLEEQLRQSQKMEAIGTLAGGVAHDFNNILTGFIGYGSIVQGSMGPDDPNLSSIKEILAASDRAAQLTRGLLAFSRRQVLNPKPIDLNETVRSMEKLLRRLIGEDILLETTLPPGKLVVMADPGQLEQVLMNLVTNARDAMPEGGRLSISTAERQLDEDYAAAHTLQRPGRYAQLAVSDSGVGMDAQTREKVFEPFFTTKEVGKGTGLGLAIVYGIVKQHGGAIDVYSEPGHGTTFELQLPLISAAPQEEAAVRPAPARGTETVLLAEDDPTVRRLIGTILKGHGYRVIEAVDGVEAVERFAAHREEIALLILDVVMPRRSGREVYDAVKAERPGIRALFLSGYTAEIIHKKGIFDEGLDFLSKPLTPSDLLDKVRAVLDRPG